MLYAKKRANEGQIDKPFFQKKRANEGQMAKSGGMGVCVEREGLAVCVEQVREGECIHKCRLNKHHVPAQLSSL